MIEPSFSQFLSESLLLLSAECRPAYTRIALLLGVLEVAIEVDRQALSVLTDRGELSVLARPVDPEVLAHTSRLALSQLLEGQCSLLEAVWDGRVSIRGSLNDLLAFHEALETYFNGAVRCPSFPGILARFLGTSGLRQSAASAAPNEASTLFP